MVCVSACSVSYWDDFRLTVNLIGLVMQLSPGTIQFFTVTMTALETPVRLQKSNNEIDEFELHILCK